jgi:precorrin-6B methylase 2
MGISWLRSSKHGVELACRERDRPDAPVLWPSVGEYSVYDDVMYYIMTSDEVRNRAYDAAIESLVEGRVVLDIGTGVDMNWALAAARAGARKVYAIEALDATYEAARAALEELPEREQIVLVHGRSTTVDLPERVDVCVSEIIGMIGSSEGVVATLDDAHERFLKPGGHMIPRRCVTRVAAVSLPDELHHAPGFDRSTRGYVERVFDAVGRPFDVRLCIASFPRSAVCSSVDTFEDLELERRVQPTYERRCRLTITEPRRLDGLVAWIELETAEGVPRIDALESSTNWLPVFLPLWFPGVPVEAGDSIELVCHTSPSADGIHPDYRLSATLASAGKRASTRFDSPYRDSGFRQSPYYERLFRI